jgi:hypothetical protein
MINLPVFSSKLLQERRRAVCDACEFKTELMGVAKCTDCGCILAPKIAIYAFTCPQRKWEDKPPKEQP